MKVYHDKLEKIFDDETELAKFEKNMKATLIFRGSSFKLFRKHQGITYGLSLPDYSSPMAFLEDIPTKGQRSHYDLRYVCSYCTDFSLSCIEKLLNLGIVETEDTKWRGLLF